MLISKINNKNIYEFDSLVELSLSVCSWFQEKSRVHFLSDLRVSFPSPPIPALQNAETELGRKTRLKRVWYTGYLGDCDRTFRVIQMSVSGRHVLGLMID